MSIIKSGVASIPPFIQEGCFREVAPGSWFSSPVVSSEYPETSMDLAVTRPGPGTCLVFAWGEIASPNIGFGIGGALVLLAPVPQKVSVVVPTAKFTNPSFAFFFFCYGGMGGRSILVLLHVSAVSMRWVRTRHRQGEEKKKSRVEVHGPVWNVERYDWMPSRVRAGCVSVRFFVWTYICNVCTYKTM